MNTALSDFKGNADAGGLSPSQQAEQALQGAKATLSNQPSTTGVACCPGRFKSREEAGKAAVCNVNRKSIAENKEYGGMIYQNPDGTYDYTGPISGNFRGVNPSDAPAPPGTTTVGNYHTHADYSIWSPSSARDINNITPKDVIKTGDPNRDDFNSDYYSSGDDIKYGLETRQFGDFTGYLGTPSGEVKSYNKKSEDRHRMGKCPGEKSK